MPDSIAHPTRLQIARLRALLDRVRQTNPFQRERLATVDLSRDDTLLAQLPLTTRDELQADQTRHPPYGTNLTFAANRYERLHQTSGSKGVPLRWLDTGDDWRWWQRCWSRVFESAGITAADRFFFPFSFGPFIGFWSAHDTARSLGAFCLPGGGMSTTARLHAVMEHAITAICCTPTYALHLASAAAEQSIPLDQSAVRTIVVAGEPGGNIKAVRDRIEQAWNARVVDHWGMTEIGALGYERRDMPGLLIFNEDECIVESIDPATGQAVPDDHPGELVVTNLGRVGSPLLRYRTGDQVRLSRHEIDGRTHTCAPGGIIGRLDDMIHVRGNNVYPSAIEAILREFDEVVEFRITVDERQALTDLRLELEFGTDCDTDHIIPRIHAAFRDNLHFRPRIALVEPGFLPRFELKARRVVRNTSNE